VNVRLKRRSQSSTYSARCPPSRAAAHIGIHKERPLRESHDQQLPPEDEAVKVSQDAADRQGCVAVRKRYVRLQLSHIGPIEVIPVGRVHECIGILELQRRTSGSMRTPRAYSPGAVVAPRPESKLGSEKINGKAGS
jgi:hypothetical protein